MKGVLELDMNLVRSIIAHNSKRWQPNRDKGLREPGLTPDEYVQKIISQYNQKYSDELRTEYEKAWRDLDDINKKIQDAQAQLTDVEERSKQYREKSRDVKAQLNIKIEQFLAMFPTAQHDDVKTFFDTPEYLLRRLNRNMNVFTKMFQAKSRQQEFQKRYDEIVGLLKSINLESLEDLDNKIMRNIQQNNQKLAEKSDELKSRQIQLREVQRKYDIAQNKYDKLQNDMHQDVAKYIDAYENRKKLRKQIPAMLNMQGLNEPVSFFQTVHGISKSDLENLLRYVGLPVGYGTQEYIVRTTKNNGKDKCLELITPFYTPENARQNIDALMRYLAEHGAEFEGVIKPATYSQINPHPKNASGRSSQNSEYIKYLIREKLREAIPREYFCMKYESEENKNKYLFRGHTFITSDINSSYATPTWRPGRTGVVYATNTPSYAVGYATNGIDNFVAGESMNPEYLFWMDGKVVGFVSVFQNSKRNIMVRDFALEKMETAKDLKKNIIKDFWVTETIVSPHNNPVVERYMVVGDKMVLIDENDEKWCEIMDYMAPDLSRTHVHGVGKEYSSGEQKAHGWQFLQRIENLQEEATRQGMVTTFDLSEEMLKKMEYTSPKNNFIKGARSVTQKGETRYLQAQQNVLE